MSKLFRTELIYEDGTAISLHASQGSKKRYVHIADRFSVWGQSVSFYRNYEFSAIFEEVLQERRSAMKNPDGQVISWRAHIAASLASHAKKLGTTFVECGVNVGLLSGSICKLFEKTGVDRLEKFYLFDTYEGIPTDQFDEKTEPLASYHNKHNYTENIYDFVQKVFSPYPYVHVVQGRVPEILEKYKEIQDVSYLSLDMNIVIPEKAAMEFFWDRMVNGGVVLLDDYGFANHGPQQDYFDSFCRERNTVPVHFPTGQAMIIKT